MMESDEESEAASQDVSQDVIRETFDPSPGQTVLPNPVAKAVSLATRSTCLVIRVGTFITSFGFDAAKFTTISSLELGRGILEGILSRAGKDVLVRSRSELARTDAETLLERSLESLHLAMTHAVFWTTAGFQMTGTTISMVSEISQLLLSSLDQFFGSTDSSRAIASIITLIRREFQNPATGVEGERVGVVDLVMGLCALAYLQRKCKRQIEEESRRLGYEETVWDVVVVNEGERVDVHEDSLYGMHKGRYKSKGHDILVSVSGEEPSPKLLATFKHPGSQASSDEDDDLPEIRLKNQILRSLPADASVSVSTAVSTRKTITVEFHGPEPPLLSPPPGVEIVEREVISPSGSQDGRQFRQSTLLNDPPTYRVVYRVDKNKMRTSTYRGHDSPAKEFMGVEVIDDSDSSDDLDPSPAATVVERHFPDSEAPPPVPPKRLSSRTDTKANSDPKGKLQTGSRQVHLNVNNLSTPPKSSRPLGPKPSLENAPNQKRQRAPLTLIASKERPDNTRQPQGLASKLPPKKIKSEPLSTSKPTEKKGGLRQALKRGTGPSISNLWNRDAASSGSSVSLQKTKQSSRPVATNKPVRSAGQKDLPVPSRSTDTAVAVNPRDRGIYDNPELIPRSASRASYISVHERRRDSIVSQTDTYSIHAFDVRQPPSPTFIRQEAKSQAGMMKSRSEKDMADQKQLSPLRNHRRVKSHIHTPSIYSMTTNGSHTSLVLSSYYQRSAYNDTDALNRLRRTGMVDGIFPEFHLLRNVTRYMLFSSASYGSNFLKFMGISKEMPILRALDDTHHEIRSFAHHTESQADSILLASFVDPQGGSDSTGSTGTGVPLVHYISLDHESKAVVLACRGTLGFEDVLADMTCDYDQLAWRGKSYRVHKGIHASARRLLYGGDGRVLFTLKEALDEFSGYGLVLCGHSLGGAVTALLGTMLAEPNPSGTGFVTSAEPHQRLLTDGQQPASEAPHICLPSGRPIHVYAYGPPGTMAPSLRKATRGLITSIVQGHDLVPYLSLGVLHDFQAVALAFKGDNNEAKAEVKQRIWQAFQAGLAEKWYANNTRSSTEGEDKWAAAALTSLRSSMVNQKLLPPGEVFTIESTRVLRRDAFLSASEEDTVRPAQRIVLKYIRDVESRFREVRFGTSMLIDHSPAKYESALSKLRFGVVETG